MRLKHSLFFKTRILYTKNTNTRAYIRRTRAKRPHSSDPRFRTKEKGKPTNEGRIASNEKAAKQFYSRARAAFVFYRVLFHSFWSYTLCPTKSYCVHTNTLTHKHLQRHAHIRTRVPKYHFEIRFRFPRDQSGVCGSDDRLNSSLIHTRRSATQTAPTQALNIRQTSQRIPKEHTQQLCRQTKISDDREACIVCAEC